MTHRPHSCKPNAACGLALLFLLHSQLVGLRADTHYVNADSATPLSPYTNWATAARVIQHAVDFSSPGDTVLVTNGLYATGGRAVYGTMTNRVAVDRPVVVRSVNGPEVTVIQGYQAPITTNGDGAVRCVCLADGAMLSGFTLTNGATRDWPGDYDREQSGAGVWCESVNAVVTNCTLTGNSASWAGGGSYKGTLNNCTLTRNSAKIGGGAEYGTLNNCTLIGNVATYGGGGSHFSTLYNCALTANSAIGRTDDGSEGGEGGGAYAGFLEHCTLTGNSAALAGGGVFVGFLSNCIVYYNTAVTGPNCYQGTLNYCCTTPSPGSGVGNIAAEPQLANAYRLSAGSPCRGSGDAAYSTGLDIDGESWLSPPSIGCDEYRDGALTGALAVAIGQTWTNVAVGFALDLTARIDGRVTACAWDFGDGTVLSNRPYASHTWTAAGDYRVVLHAYNEDHWDGVSATVAIRVLAEPVVYVSADSSNPLPPYETWATAARTIQDAVDAVTVPGALLLVTNGIYSTGGRAVFGTMTNRVAVDRPVVLRSVNGPEATVIQGYQVPGTTNGDGAVRCVYLTNGAVLSGFTLTNGATRSSGGLQQEQSGGGVWCASTSAVVTNCVIAGNSALYSGGGACSGTLNNCVIRGNSADWLGGGAYYGMLNNCLLTGNWALQEGGDGGGAFDGILNNCTLTGNSARHGGGAEYGTLNNCIVYYNTADTDPNTSSSTLHYCCSTPAAGEGSITNEPHFIDPTIGDYRLQPTSPCIDAGINQDWVFGAVDLAGNPRILNGRVDMGAYETPFTLDLHVWLQGPYDTNTHTMVGGHAASIPLTSPYAADPRRVSAVPSTAVDWVLVELRDTNGNTLVAKSAFLNTQGEILSTSGATGITAEVSAGYYSIVIKHRNHLAVMSAQPVAFTDYLVSYDFTTGSDKYSGGSDGALELESGEWGMIAGDADGDGEILAVDGSISTNQLEQSGYCRADFDLDGAVSSDDLALWTSNQGRTNSAANGQTILSLALSVSPARKTLLPRASQAFGVTGTTETLTWAVVKNPSGGTISSSNTTSVVYQAGATSNTVDIVQAWDTQGRLGRAYVNVISPDDVARAGKAVVIAGQKSLEDPLWPVTDYLADLAYNTLLYRGFSKENIRYLNPVTDQDVDGNGELDDIALRTTLANVADTFTNWAANPDRLFVYLVDHGGSSSDDGYFRLNAAEVLTARQLDLWLDAIQDRYTNEVVVVIDCCESGSFLEALAYEGGKRTVMTACGTNEPTYFVRGGQVSFSDAFFSGLLMGLDLQDCFVLARDAMVPYQRSWMDADGNGLYLAEADPGLAAGVYIGPSFVAGKDIPQIGHVVGKQSLRDISRATLWAYDIVSEYPIERVWCAVVPPGHSPDPANPVADLPILELAYNATSGRYEAVYSGFTQIGVYKVIYYARDIWGSVSAPRQSSVTQNGFEELAILVAGGSTNDGRWMGIGNVGRLAYHTLRNRWFERTNIYYLSPSGYEDGDEDGTNDIAGPPTLENLQHAITSWASSANNLTVYLVGEGSNGLFRLNGDETLSPANLRTWLDGLSSSNMPVSVVLDFPGAGAFLPALTPASGPSRVCVASTGAGQECLFANGGTVSFSQYLLSGVANGLEIRRAFEQAREAIARASGRLRQHPVLDDDGDGISSSRDGLHARQRYIGTPFLTGADMPALGEVMPDAILNSATGQLLWVSGVTGVASISNVWCVITPPDYQGQGDLPEENLSWNETAERYELLYTNFTTVGSYVCTFYARDTVGEVSSPKQADVTVAYTLGIDDELGQTPIFEVGTAQQYHLASTLDEQWVKFYAPTGCFFNIDATALDANSDLQLELYGEQPGGTLLFVDEANNYGPGAGFCENTTVDLKTGRSGLWPGVYYVRVKSANTGLLGPGSKYKLQIYMPIGPAGGVPFPGLPNTGGLLPIGSFYVYLGPPQALAAGGWRIQQVTNELYFSDNSAVYLLPASPNYTLAFRDVPGFHAPTNRSLVINTDQTTGVMAYYLYTNVSPRAECPLLSTNGVLALTFLGQAGTRYALEESTNLVHWMPLATNLVPSDGLLHFNTTTLPPKDRAFYRARLAP